MDAPSSSLPHRPEDLFWMNLALRLAARGYGSTSPNPMVGAVLVKRGKVLGEGWHHRAGAPHAEVEAIYDALARQQKPAGGTLYVTLEPCCTQGRTPPCTEAILTAGISRVVAGATDPNPKHAGRGFQLLRAAGIQVLTGVLSERAARLNEAFNHWITQHTPFVVVKAAMSLDGKIATGTGESKWITGLKARAFGMKLRQGADAVLVGVNTVVADDPKLTVRGPGAPRFKHLRRIVLDPQARTPLTAHVLSDSAASFLTTIVASKQAPPKRIARMADRANVIVAPMAGGKFELDWLLDKLGQESVTSLLVEGGGEVNASFLLGGFAHRIAFFYAPRIIGGRGAPGAVGGAGVQSLSHALALSDLAWRRLDEDFLLTARVGPSHAARSDC
jgi:diaminohydroxyphosphoribosylaminopyrimidine deaminase / 5-amino-6-(5-phosphoribosylamino)uracil reductase